MSFEHGTITDQKCDECGYTLSGLPLGSKCPECGHASGAKEGKVFQTTMSYQAPSFYIRWVRYGFLFCMISLIGGLAGPFVVGFAAGKNAWFPVALSFFIGASFCWTLGVWMITRKREKTDGLLHDAVLDNTKLVQTIRLIALAWPTWILLVVGTMMFFTAGPAGNITGAVPVYYSSIIAAVGLIAWIGLIPVCVYFAELAYWAADDKLASRLRGTAWVMMVFGVVAVCSKLVSMLPIGLSNPAKFVHVWSTIFSIGATIVLFYSMFRMSILLNWVISHQRISANKHARLAARIEHQMNHQGKVSKADPCAQCGYDLKGLPYSGNCPECGSAYGDASPVIIRDPANDKPRHDETPIHVEESTGGTITHRPHLEDPIPDAHDIALDDGTGSIPLADESADDLNQDRA